MQQPSPLIRASSRSNLYRLHVNEHDLPYIELGEQPPPFTRPAPFIPTTWPAIGQMNISADPRNSVSYTVTYPQPEPEHIAEARLRGERIFSLTLDERFGMVAAEKEIERWAPFLADAMAVAAGYTSHGKHSRRLNRHGVSR